MKKFICALICLSLLVLSAACGQANTAPKESSGATTAAGTQAAVSSAPAAEVQGKPVVIMIRESRQSNPEDEALVHKYMEEQSGVKFEITRIADADDFKNKVNVALASAQDLDIISMNSDIFGDLIQRGALFKLNDLIDKYGGDLLKQYSEECWKAVTDGEGSIWAVPSKARPTGVMLQDRKDWREQLNIGPIATVDDLHNYLKAVKTADFDKNGKEDTVPFMSYGVYDGIERTLGYLVTGANVAGGSDANYLDENGQIVPGYLHPKFKDYLELVKNWYAEGLIEKDIYTVKQSQQDDLIIANKVGAVSSWYSNTFRPWDKLRATVPDAEYEFAMPKTVSGGDFAFWLSPITGPSASIVSYSKNTEWAMKFLDWTVASPENFYTQKRGVPGVHWEYTNRDKGYFKYLKSPDDLTKTYNYAINLTFTYGDGPWCDRGESPNFVDNNYYKAQDLMASLPVFEDPDWYVRYNWKGTDIDTAREEGKTMMSEAITKILIGQRPISDWDNIVKQYKEIFADEYTKLATEQYNKATKK